MMPHSWIGKCIGGRYEIESLLGQGGMSAVYRATDPNLRRTVAIKLIHPHLSAHSDFVRRFKEEAAAVARLRHPNIVQVYDFNNDGETYYMVMEYLEGETLQVRLRRLATSHHAMPFTQVIDFCAQLCDAVGYAHEQEVLHRDIKPANIMLTPHEQAILMDFGIAKIIGGEHHTATGSMIGTAKYMSPEQIRGEQVSERSDIYSLGVTLYEMICGRPPFNADSAATLMMMVLNQPLPPLQELRKQTPEGLVGVVEKALAKAPAERFNNMTEMAIFLRQAKRDAENAVSADTVLDVDGSVRAGGAALLDGELSESMVLQVTPSGVDDPQSAPVQQVSPASGKSSARINIRRFMVPAAALLLLGIMTIAVFYMQDQKTPVIGLAAIPEPETPFNIQTASYVVSLGHWETGSIITDLAFSPDTDLIGTVNGRPSRWLSKYRYYSALWQVNSGSLRGYQFGHSQPINGIVFASDGQHFATGADDGVIIGRTSDGGMERRIAGATDVTDVDFAPNNLLLASGSWEGHTDLWDLSDGHLLRTFQANEESVRDVEFSPDGKLLASASDDHTVRLWHVSDGALLHTLLGHSGYVLGVAFSPDGALLASASQDGTVGLWRVSDGNLVRRFQGHNTPVLDIGFSTDATLIVSGSEDGVLILWDVISGDMVRTLVDYPDSVMAVTFSADGYMLVSGFHDGTVQFWGMSEAIPTETDTSRIR